jgi:hypothetical protein
VKVGFLDCFQESYSEAKREYGADWKVRPALFSLWGHLDGATEWLNGRHQLNRLSDDILAAARLEFSGSLDDFIDKDPRAALGPRTSSYLRAICEEISVTGFPTIDNLDPDSRIYVWQPPSNQHQKHARAVSVYLDHPEDARVLLHVWIGATDDLQHCLEKFKSDNFKWGSLGGKNGLGRSYGEWLQKQQAGDG